MNGRRHLIEACSTCTVDTDGIERVDKAKNDPLLQNYLAKLIQSKDEYYHDERSLEPIPWE